MKILLADNHDSFVYNIFQILHEQGGAIVDIVKTDEIDVSTLFKYQGIVFSPGPDIIDPGDKMKAILAAVDHKVPILGICLGYDIIAEYYGAGLINSEQTYHGLQRKIHIIDTSDALFQGMPPSINAGLYHSWVVDKGSLEPDLIPTAISEDRLLMAFRHRKYPVYGVQFHPESIMTPLGAKLLLNWLQLTGQ